jgi:hypothetical protein
MMAGSYHHLLHGWSLIENMGDAYVQKNLDKT